MKYLKNYDELNESTFFIVSSILFSLLFLSGLLKDIFKKIRKTNSSNIYIKLLNITKKINRIVKLKNNDRINITKTINGYSIEIDDDKITITDQKIQLDTNDINIVIMPYDGYLKSNDIEYDIDEKSITMLKKFMIEINEKLVKII